ncbi:receptor-type tyrosine-protein phosphatase eta-like [Ambystoma mexicanum]|uniref:receptor-type tyrosine-protein phosphatase eta-like n=1 Tax=Ambystoma mexicanum TaxID=8296 RepID=UPI0037E92770
MDSATHHQAGAKPMFLLYVYKDPGLVRNLSLNAVSITELFINWSQPDDGASAYLVQVIGTPSLSMSVITEHVRLIDLIPGNYYTVKVSAQDGPRQGNAETVSGFTLPNVTNNLSVSDVSIDSVSLSWDPPTGNKSSYLVEVFGTPPSSFMVDNESASITDLVPGNFYTFLVSSVSGDHTLQGKKSTISTYTVPNVINNLILTNYTIDSISLSWDPPTSNKSYYLVEVHGVPATNVTVVNESVTIFNLIPGNLYNVFVSAVAGDGLLEGESSKIRYLDKLSLQLQFIFGPPVSTKIGIGSEVLPSPFIFYQLFDNLILLIF